VNAKIEMGEINKLPFSHFVELFKVSDPQKRLFYEIECIKGTWSVRELKRQINSLYYERAGISTPATYKSKHPA
jgi:predicted nuclease of restriction endonuclease-like (RecB) superfamily